MNKVLTYIVASARRTGLFRRCNRCLSGSRRFMILCIILMPCGISTGSDNQSKDMLSPTTSLTGVEMSSNLKYVSLSLKESIIYALRNNFDIEISKLNTKSSDYGITVEKARFDPTLQLTGSIQDSEVPSSDVLQVGSATTTAITPFVSQGNTADAVLQSLMPTGAIVSLEYNIFRSFFSPSPFQLLNPSYTNFIQAQVTQPLLKGAGWFYNRSPIYIARNNKKISLTQFKATAIEVSNAVQEAYWSFVKAMEDLKVAKKSLERAEDLLKKNQIQVDAGTLAPLDIVDAEASVASRVEAVITAENAIKDREDELKRVMNMADNEIISDATIMPVDKPVFEPVKVELKDTLKVAMERRPELHGLQFQVENAGMQTRRRKNELFPQLDFTGGVRYTGLGEEVSAANDSTFSEQFQGQFFTLALSIPIGNRSPRSQYKKAKIAEQQANMNVKKKELDIVVEARTAVRAVMTNIERVKAAIKARELAGKRLDVEEKKYSVGRSTSLEVLRQQEGLATAEGGEAKALIDYQISLGYLEKVKGTILDSYDIRLEEEKT